MKKIMFNDKYGLTQAVLEGRKTMTRRAVSAHIHKKASLYRQEYFDDTLDALFVEDSLLTFSPFKPDEVVAVAQPYRDIRDIIGDIQDGKSIKFMAGWNNKMFVRADLMPHQIRIMNVRVERLQDISDEDCLKEGVYWDYGDYPYMATKMFKYDGKEEFIHPKAAFASLIDKVSGKGTLESNPWVFVYEFELVK